MKGLALFLREKFHPLYYLRKFRFFQTLTRLLDVPIAIRFPYVSHRIYVSLTKNLSFVLTGGRAGEQSERINFQRVVQLGRFRTFFDVGANVGLYGFMFRSMVGDGTVIMFEPDPDNVRLMQRTIDRENLPGVRVVQAAVSDEAGKIAFHVDPLSGATGSITTGSDGELFLTRHHKFESPTIVVDAIMLDTVPGLAKDPDFIKIDVEGAELKVLRGARNLIARSQPAIFFECDGNAVLVGNFLRANGYEIVDFSTMKFVRTPVHNNLALHRLRHGVILGEIK